MMAVRHLQRALVLCLLVGACQSLSVQRNAASKWTMSTPAPRGSARKPFDKQKVAILGAGGYLGGCIFGFLQRCSTLYGTGIGGVRNIGATAVCADNLNRILGKNFILAFAGEDVQRLTDMTDVRSITQRLKGYSAVVVGTDYYLEQRPVTGNTYETSPNSKTFEFYLDSPRRGIDEDGMVVNPDYQSLLFENAVKACQESDTVKHLVVIETPSTTPERAALCAKLLDESKLSFTYVRVCGSLENSQDYTFSKGTQGNLEIESFTFAPDYTAQNGHVEGSWIKDLTDTSNGGVVYREDVAALAVQCLQSLDWSNSRCLLVSSGGKLQTREFKGRLDKEWCVNSEILVEKLAVVQ